MSKQIIFVSSGAARTSKGYVAFAWSDDGLYANSFFHPTKREALAQLKSELDKTPFEVEQADFEKESAAPGWISRFFAAFANGEGSIAANILKAESKFDFGNASSHQKKVWKRLSAIPWGETLTYGDIAHAVGSSARAVGGACAANRCPMVIPCHRVVGARGALTGFGGGIELKSALLSREIAAQTRKSAIRMRGSAHGERERGPK